jgi:23S rRNA pseudouridine1911/1915/1917 synthase
LAAQLNGEAKLIRVREEAAGARLDIFLASAMSGTSRARIQRAIESGDVLVNDRAVKPSYRVRPGDLIEVELMEPPPTELLPEPIPIKIVYEDGDLILVDKPAGMVVHPGAGIWSGTLANALAHHFKELSGAAGQIRPGIVHRLDKETSGLIVIAKNDRAHDLLSEQFHSRQVFKLYLALVHGCPSEPRGQITARIGRNRRNRTRMSVLGGGAGREAITIYEVAQRYDEFALLKVWPKTGRTHQIRVHMAHIGHPVVGDAIYGRGRENLVREARIRGEIKALGRHFLHSAALGFHHPSKGKWVEFSSELPPELASFLRLIG